jgi:hypothetical protein
MFWITTNVGLKVNNSQAILNMPKHGPCHASGLTHPGLHRRESVLIPGQSMSDLWWRKWHWHRILTEYFRFSLSVSFHQWPIVIYRLSHCHGQQLTESLNNTFKKSVCRLSKLITIYKENKIYAEVSLGPLINVDLRIKYAPKMD